eukprot:TRINITY_DN5044_c0_g2_i3.p1 TRINITY_DN5044_c0_g2~~TRINITY_DN5044_c0_g2_i3.p1  ORF type:complete len:882 (-),score=96.13 TRINITY_DN5044_c0_g2_i3:228-2489(-)
MCALQKCTDSDSGVLDGLSDLRLNFSLAPVKFELIGNLPWNAVHSSPKHRVGQGAHVLHLELFDHNTVSVIFRYDKALHKCLFRNFDMRYDDQHQSWLISSHSTGKLVYAATVTRQLPVQVSLLWKTMIDGISAQEKYVESSEKVEELKGKIEDERWNKLFQFQKEGVEYAFSRKGRILLADEMGLGKTVQALTIMGCYEDDWPLLILCPSSMRLVWLGQMDTWLPQHLRPSETGSKVLVWLISSSADISKVPRLTADQRLVVITSYKMVQKIPSEVMNLFRCIVVDESHNLKNPRAQQTKFMRDYVKKCRRVLLMSGTPSLARPIELYSQLDMLRPGKFGSKHEFGERYCQDLFGNSNFRNRMYPGQEYMGAARIRELNCFLQSTVMIRRLKSVVQQQIPDKTRCVIPIRIHDKELEKIVQLKTQLDSLKKLDANVRDSESRRIQQNLYALSGSVKVPSCWNFIQDKLADCPDENMLVFAHHKSVLDSFESKAVGQGYKFIRIDGQTDQQSRKEQTDLFQDVKNGIRLAMLSITAAGVGITLTAASIVVFAELVWTPGLLTQAEDRAHRVGQKADVQIYYLIAKGTIDDYMWKTLQTKITNVGVTLEGDRSGTAQGLTVSSFSNKRKRYTDEKIEDEDDEKWDFEKIKQEPESSQNYQNQNTEIKKDQEVQKNGIQQQFEIKSEQQQQIVSDLQKQVNYNNKKQRQKQKQQQVNLSEIIDLSIDEMEINSNNQKLPKKSLAPEVLIDVIDLV